MPHQFLQEAPLVDGDWIDSYMVELAEWGARIREREFLLEEPEDNHPAGLVVDLPTVPTAVRWE